MLKPLTFFVLLLCNTCLLFAQPSPPSTDYNFAVEKKFTFYQRIAKQQVKQQNYSYAAVSTIRAMAVAEKKRQIEKTGELLAEVYPKAINESKQNIRWLTTQLRNADANLRAALQYEIWNIYRDLNYLIALYRKLPTARQTSKMTIKPFHDELVEADNFQTA